MPYTISHVAAAVPFTRWLIRLRVLSAVVIGSMVPDFGYLLPERPDRFETHSAIALATFCLPVGLITYWIFQRLMKTPLMSLLPDQAYMRWRPYAAPAALSSLRQWLLAICGVLAGATVHLIWDAFTHEGARGVRMVPELSDPVIQVHDHAVTGATLLQDLSSLFGFLIVIAAIIYALRGTGRQVVASRVLTRFERRLWVFAFVLLTLGLGAEFFILGRHIFWWRWIFNAAVSLLRALAVSILCVSLALQGYLRARR